MVEGITKSATEKPAKFKSYIIQATTAIVDTVIVESTAIVEQNYSGGFFWAPIKASPRQWVPGKLSFCILKLSLCILKLSF